MDMDKLKELFSGIAVVIDDEIKVPEANINKIIKQIESANIPVLKYPSLPEKDIVSHFQNLSFLLLDWRLEKIEKNEETEKIGEGIRMGDTKLKSEDNENIDFIKNLNKNCFCPIFIFTNENPADIEDLLIQENLYVKDGHSNIFVQLKSNLLGKRTLFDKVSKWLRKTPSIYVLKEWEKNYQSCKTKLFYDMHSLNPSWPIIMWKNFDDDGVNKSLEMRELISRNIHSRMIPFHFENDILDKKFRVPPSRDELKKVLEGERFLNSKSLHDDDIGTGDLFEVKSQDNGKTTNTYYLNIRAQCDLLRSRNVELYCLKGRIFDEKNINKKDGLPLFEGQFLEKTNHAVVPFLHDGKIIEFLFYDIKIKKWNTLKGDRVGRLLPPYITRIQQRYSLYMLRQGLPRIPDAAIKILEPDMNDSEALVYQTSDGKIKIDVRLANRTVWLTQDHIARLFGKAKLTINKHIKNIFAEGERVEANVMKKFRNSEIQAKTINYYNLDLIISVNYRVNSHQGPPFYSWAIQQLKKYIVKKRKNKKAEVALEKGDP